MMLYKQNLKRVEMELKFQLMMGKLVLYEIQELTNLFLFFKKGIYYLIKS